MQKKKILIPLAACAMLLPMSASACNTASNCATWNYDCSANCCAVNDCVEGNYCGANDWLNYGSYCDSDQVVSKPNTDNSTDKPVTDSVIQSSSASTEILRQVNEYRAQYGLSSLSRSAELDRAAALRATEIARVFSHTRPDGSSWSTVSDQAFGENIAKGYRTADKTMAAWMSSSGHRANILRESYGSIGIAAVEIDGTMYWVQLFGK